MLAVLDRSLPCRRLVRRRALEVAHARLPDGPSKSRITRCMFSTSFSPMRHSIRTLRRPSASRFAHHHLPRHGQHELPRGSRRLSGIRPDRPRHSAPLELVPQLQEGLHLLPWRRPDGTRTARARPPPGAAIARRGQSLLRASSPPAAAGRIPSRPPPAAPATPDPRRRGRSTSGRRARVHSREPAPDHRRRAGEAGDSRCRPWLITPDQPETFVGALTR
jgi:hypothetical protein